MSNVRATSPGSVPPDGRRPEADRQADRHLEVPSITSAPEPLADDQARRTKRYLIQMGVRLVFFAAAVAIFMTGWAPRWVMWALIVGAVVLPYSAVLFANAGRDRVSYDTSPVTDPTRTELPPSVAQPRDPTVEDGAGSVLGDEHVVIEHQDDGTADPPGSGDDDDTDDSEDR